MSESPWLKVSQFLVPFSGIYALAVSLRNFAYDCKIFKTHHLQVPVISIGNLTVGGTGKTPVTVSIACLLRDPPYQQSPAILSRGYRRKSKGYQLVSSGEGPIWGVEKSGDEPHMIAEKLPGIPVAVDANRVRGGRYLFRHLHPSVILLDDAFQHRRIHRDLDIVLLDSRTQIHSNRLLPAGTMREPLSSLRRADLVVLTRFQTEAEDAEILWNDLEQRLGEDHLCACDVKPVRYLSIRDNIKLQFDDLRGKRIVAFCGIAKPDSFWEVLKKLNLEIAVLIRFPDHYRYRAKDAQKLVTVFSEEKADYLITTEKDAVKLGGLFDALPILKLEIEVDWLRGLENLHREFQRILSRDRD